MSELTHLTESDQPRMVDVSAKAETVRTATAGCRVRIGADLLSQMDGGELKNKKGPVLHTAILAGIQATKLTSQLIPLCHPLPLDSAQIDIVPLDDERLQVNCTARTTGKTGVEMEALTGASVAALTLYDMCKAVNPAITISDLKLQEKTGGKSDYQARQEESS
ncbi:MAG: cyclic pyranopterin monophosphate synthase MoaC [Verrucomicrobiota bacterium JB023]|nr:cyclic pyranopterin monophosphate synthase MoaC [Verrucomicrobiota bacterium JB023]